jgi:hypothetical protein
MSKVTVRLDEETLQGVGSASITGRVVTEMSHTGFPDEIVLEFPQSSSRWRRENSGPNQIILNEYNVMCLVEDLLSIVGHGVKVSVREVIEDPQ